jgi:DNA end-binding protein Ku
MAKRPSWSGFLRLSLVTCPIQLFNATTTARSVAFHFIHRKTHNRVHMRPFDPELGEVERKDLVRGYELDKGRYVVVTGEDLRRIRLKSTKTIEIEKFVKFEEIDPLYLDGAYYVVPNGKLAIEAYAVIREAMRKEGYAALGRLAISYREHVITIAPREAGMILHRMRDAREVEAHAPFDELRHVKVDPKMVAIAAEIIEQMKGKFEPSKFADPYEEALLEMLKRRAKGAKPLPGADRDEGRPSNVVNLKDALRKSLGSRSPDSVARGRGKAAAEDGERRVVKFRKPAAGGRRAGAKGRAAKNRPVAKQRKRAAGQ